MALNKKKIVAYLAAAALFGGALVVCRAQSAANEPEKPLSENSSSWFTKDPNVALKPAESLDTREMFFKMMFAVLLVVALGVAAIYVTKKVLPKITNLPGREIRIIETVHLGPRKAVHLIEAGGRRLLIGSTNESITKLADVTDAPTNLSEQEPKRI